MKEHFIALANEAKKEAEERYQYLAEGYFLGYKKFETLVGEIEKTVAMSIVDKNNISSKINEPVIFISNHPKLDQSLCIPANKIQNVKGGNVFNFNQFNYPIVRQVMLKNILKRPFSTISLDNGWSEAMKDCWNTIITRGGTNRFKEIKEKYISGQSMVIYPDGKSTGKAEMLPFRTGFYHLARELGFKKIILGISSPVLSVSGINSLKSFEVIEVPDDKIEPQKFAEFIREKIMAEMKINKQDI